LDRRRLVENQIGLLEAGVEVSDLPLVGVFSEWKLFRLRVAEISRRPFQLLHLRVRWSGCLRGTHPHVSFGPRVRTSRPEALHGIHHERQRLEVDLNFLNRFGGGVLVDCGDGQNRFAFIQRFHGEAALAQLAGDDAFAEVGALHNRR
jgi:hypothetical protein